MSSQKYSGNTRLKFDKGSTIKENSNEKFEIYSPFEIVIDPMERLLLINFEKDPDEIYIGFEPQVFNDSQNGTGMLIIGWRVDGKVDVYHQPEVHPVPQKYDIAGKGLAHLIEREMADSYYFVKDHGVEASIKFTDLLERKIIIEIKEHHPVPREPFGLLAPMGDAAEKPSAMPLIFLHEFYFVREKQTEITIDIDGKHHKPDKLPLPLDGTKMYFTRYSPDPLIVTLNPAFHNYLIPIRLEKNREATSGETKFEIEEKDKKFSIKSMVRKHKEHTIQLTFEPPFPDIGTIADQSQTRGNFIIRGHPTTGKIRGHYEVLKKAGNIEIIMIPSGGWIPNERKLMLKFLYTVAKIFRYWPKTYRWHATISKDLEKDQFYMTSSWERFRKN